MWSCPDAAAGGMVEPVVVGGVVVGVVACVVDVMAGDEGCNWFDGVGEFTGWLTAGGSVGWMTGWKVVVDAVIGVVATVVVVDVVVVVVVVIRGGRGGP